MCLVARLAEVHFGEDLWEFRGDDGAGLKEAFERYSAFALGERAAQPPEDLGSYLWLWQFAALRWPQEPRYRAVLALGSQEKFILQSIGPVALVLGGLDGQP
jgi:hypothetical protein